MNKNSPIPVEQKTGMFYDDEITAVVVAQGGGAWMVYVPLQPLCQYLGVSWAGQFERINCTPVLSDVLFGIRQA